MVLFYKGVSPFPDDYRGRRKLCHAAGSGTEPRPKTGFGQCWNYKQVSGSSTIWRAIASLENFRGPPLGGPKFLHRIP